MVLNLWQFTMSLYKYAWYATTLIFSCILWQQHNHADRNKPTGLADTKEKKRAHKILKVFLYTCTYTLALSYYQFLLREINQKPHHQNYVPIHPKDTVGWVAYSTFYAIYTYVNSVSL